jgi:glyoxylase-like metal-dependent hydrolase (beta-lactamase superfamily II)
MPSPAELSGLSILERGWLSSNNVLLHGRDDEPAVLIDSSHLAHAAQTVALIRHALGGAALARIVNTHLHSDHCGGNAALQRAFACRITIPPGHWQAVLDWDEQALGYRPTGHRCERFRPDDRLLPGQSVDVGGRRWLALAASGHDPHSLILFDARHGVVISADALWENGFGVVFPELDGDEAFDDVARALDLIESLDARWALPGHGTPFTDLAGALARARRRLAAFVADPRRHDRHAAKVMIKYHLLEAQSCTWPALLTWLDTTQVCQNIWRRLGQPDGSLAAFAEQLVTELVATGALQRRGDRVLNA